MDSGTRLGRVNSVHQHMKVTVIIPSYRRPLDLRRCLAAIWRQSKPADEVLVVGRDGDTQTLDIISEVRLFFRVSALCASPSPAWLRL